MKDQMTDDHRLAFGTIINNFATLEHLIDELILKLIGADLVEEKQRSSASANAIILLSKLQTREKTDFLRSLDGVEVEHGSWIGSGLTAILDRIKTKATLRNNVAHCIWDDGRRPGHIKPLVISAGGNLKIMGPRHNEKEWSAQDLAQAADEIIEITRDLMKWMESHGLRLRLPEIPE